MSREIRKTMPRRPVRRGPGGHGPGAPAEKPKEFKKTLGKTLRYMRKNILAMAIAFVLAIGGVVATLLVPDIMGQATDELMTGVLRAQIYKTVKLAGSMAIKDALKKSDPVLLEPIEEVEVETPEQYMGDVMGNLSSRRGKIEGMEDRRDTKVIRAKVPLGEMFGYATDLRSQTQGRASYTMQFDSYEPVPKNIRDEIVAKNGGNAS